MIIQYETLADFITACVDSDGDIFLYRELVREAEINHCVRGMFWGTGKAAGTINIITILVFSATENEIDRLREAIKGYGQRISDRVQRLFGYRVGFLPGRPLITIPPDQVFYAEVNNAD